MLFFLCLLSSLVGSKGKGICVCCFCPLVGSKGKCMLKKTSPKGPLMVLKGIDFTTGQSVPGLSTWNIHF